MGTHVTAMTLEELDDYIMDSIIMCTWSVL
jgi:hypothetical protein